MKKIILITQKSDHRESPLSISVFLRLINMIGTEV